MQFQIMVLTSYNYPFNYLFSYIIIGRCSIIIDVIYLPLSFYDGNYLWSFVLSHSKYGRRDSQVVFALDFWTLVCYALGHELEPWWWQLFFGPKHNIYAYFHDFYLIHLIWYYVICLSNLSLNCETEKGK